ncbi:MAG: glycosyltransferase [Candidatus Methanofastidiosia archaeon]
MSPLTRTILIWGVWILIPIVIDGLGTILRVGAVLLAKKKTHAQDYTDAELPKVSIIIPAYNEEKIIERCLNSLKLQNYPNNKMEILVVDDGSVDATREVVINNINGNGNGRVKINGEFLSVGEYKGAIKLFTSGRNKGKANALNLGIRHSHGDIIMTIDSDTVIDPQAIRNMASYFIENPELGTACGNIEINWRLLEERDKEGNIVLDENGDIKEKKINFFESALAKSQFLEYLNAFRLGRHYQSIVNSEYTLSGAFSAFRKEVFENSSLYSDLTVSEDFDISLDLHQQDVKVGFAPTAKAWVEPIIDPGALYAQRVRWRRGQLEVAGLHKNMVGSGKYGTIGRFGIPAMLMFDHTLAFPRIIWTFLIAMFPLFGYNQSIIALMFVLMYVFYVVFDIAQTLAAYTIVDDDTKESIKDSFQYVLMLPIYRLAVFYFRMSGYLIVLKEPQEWKITGPFEGVRTQVTGVTHRINGGAQGFISFLYSIFDIFRF